MYSNAKRGVLDSKINRYGYLYNHCILLNQRYFKLTGKRIHRYTLNHHLAMMKRRPKWKSLFVGLDSMAVQNIAERIEWAYNQFFRKLKQKQHCSPPRLRKISKYRSFTMCKCGYTIVGNRIRINEKWYGFHKDRELKGKIKRVTVKRDGCGDFYLFITTDYVRTEEKPKSGSIVGFDFGIKTYLTGSDGTKIDAPTFLKNNYKKQKRLTRILSLRPTQSKNHRRAKLELARFHRRIVNRRSDFQWKLAHSLIDKYDTIFFESLNLKSMCNLNFGSKLEDYAFYSLVQKLKHLASVYGKEVVNVNRFFPSSKRCSKCGFTLDSLKLTTREWTCPNCGERHDRDVNAAINILMEGASSIGLDKVRPPSCEGGVCCLNPQSRVLKEHDE